MFLGERMADIIEIKTEWLVFIQIKIVKKNRGLYIFFYSIKRRGFVEVSENLVADTDLKIILFGLSKLYIYIR